MGGKTLEATTYFVWTGSAPYAYMLNLSMIAKPSTPANQTIMGETCGHIKLPEINEFRIPFENKPIERRTKPNNNKDIKMIIGKPEGPIAL